MKKREPIMKDNNIRENIKKAKKSKLIFSILKFIILILIVLAVPLYLILYHRELLASFESFDDIIAFIQHYKTHSILIYILIEIVQIIISVLPGQVFEFAGGYLFGFPLGLVFSLIGVSIGTTISYHIAKLLGRDVMLIMYGEENLNYLLERLNSKKAYIIVYILFLIPGLPKDVVSYVAGVSSMPFKPFLIVSLLGRLFGMCGSLLIGSLYFKGHYIMMGIVFGILAIIFVTCLVKREKIKKYIDKFYIRITK